MSGMRILKREDGSAGGGVSTEKAAQSTEEVCNADRNGRILNSDYSSLSFSKGFRAGLSAKVLPFQRTRGVRQVSMLSDLKVGETGVLVALELPESVQNHLMHMGFVPNALVKALRRAPAGDPVVYGVDGMEIALRHETADAIRMKSVDDQILQQELRELTEAVR